MDTEPLAGVDDRGKTIALGICPDNQWEDIRVVLSRAAEVEAAGFDSVWLGDHLLPFQHSRGHNRSVMVEMAAFLQRTTKIMIGAQVVAPIGLRHQPVDVALDIATLAILYPGRVALTVGTGEAMNERNATGRWPTPAERLGRLGEALELIRECWESDDYFHHTGEYFDSFFFLYSKPFPPVPLLSAANGRRSARLAGRLADGFCCVGVTPEHFSQTLVPAFESGARESGRDPSPLSRSVWVPTTYHPDPHEAAAASKLEAGVLIPGYLDEVTDPRQMEVAGRNVVDDVIRKASCVASEGRAIVDFFIQYVQAGATEVIWGDLSPDPALSVSLARETVVPEFRARCAEVTALTLSNMSE